MSALCVFDLPIVSIRGKRREEEGGGRASVCGDRIFERPPFNEIVA